ncbi:hypothetical protein SGUI_1311 [Serinicoccus hydrothermalis]|uniref:Uncharacterized protein n=1 Tax=Serinicoccus hydrothermalis TaxID=1758689 RepID=A0A1B1NB98_9MICO|nr:hypothetical protein SGUI_1311 [Serinicoccus hydrothermalis]
MRRIRGRLAARRVRGPRTEEVAPQREDEQQSASVVLTVRELIRTGKAGEAVSTGYALRQDPATRQLGDLVLGLCRRSTSTSPLAWRDLAEVTRPALVALAADDWFVPAYQHAPEQAARVLREVLAQDLHLGWTGTQLLLVARAAFQAQDWDAVREVCAAATSGRATRVAASRRHELAELVRWMPGGDYRQPVPALEADARIGVMNYLAPGPGSRNVGDWIQTLASIGHLVRHRNLTYVGTDPDLVGLVTDLADGVREERRLPDSPTATVQLVEVQRDGMPLQELPNPTWVPTFGWYLHPVTAQDYLFPFADAVRPIFISFHVNKPDMLTPEAVAYLRRYGPVGCRDWQTVALLRALDVPAFFSGCMTTTVDTVVPPGDPAARTETAYIDFPGGPADAEVVEQSITGLRSLSFADNLRLARDWVQDYATRYRAVRTSRLHANLPSRSVGCEVEFVPKNRSDVRFGGLIDIDDDAFEAIRHGILDKLDAVLRLVLAGEDEDRVYARWREVCAADVARAERVLDAREADLPATAPVPPQAEGAQHVVVVDLGPGEAPHLPGLLGALAGRVPPGTAVVVSGEETLRLGDLPDVGLPVTLVNRQTVPLDRLEPRPDGAAVRELLLAHAVLGVGGPGRVLVLPAGVLLPDDLRPLLEHDLDGRPVAAPREPRGSRRLAVGLVRSLSSRQGDDAAGALDLLVAGSRRIDVLGAPFDPVVLVADPALLRAAGAEEVVPLMLRYGATFREALNIVLGDRWTLLPESWATMPHLQTPQPDAQLLTYRVGARPWSRLTTPGRDEWRAQQRG